MFDEPGYGRAPQMCVDATGRCHAVWISCGPDGECLRMARREPFDHWSDPECVVPRVPFITGLSIAPWRSGVLAAWVDGGYDDAGLKLGEISDGGALTARPLLSHRDGPAHPALVTDDTGLCVVCTVKTTSLRRVLAFTGARSLEDLDPLTLSSDERMAACPAVALSGGRAIAVWQEMETGISAIAARTVDGGRLSQRITIAEESPGTVALPDVCSAPDGGVWIAWQSDVDDVLGPGLVRGVHVAYLDASGTVRRPVEPSPAVERRGHDEDQGFESPSITTLDDGRLVIIGRGSQSVRRQDLGAAGWSDRVQLDSAGWSCRGRRFSVAAASEGLFVIGRERAGITARRLPSPDSAWAGFPRLAERARRLPPKRGRAPGTVEERLFGDYRVLFGDIHQHTTASDGTGSAEEAFHRARGRYLDDVVAVSDHESFLGKRTPEGEWRERCRAADEFYEPGAFVTLHAFEWTGRIFPGPGHKVVYLPPEGGPLLSRDDPWASTSPGLIHTCQELGAIAVPHHVGWTGADMENHLPGVQTCFEIVSCHGAYERQGLGPIGTRGDDKAGQFTGDALDRNLRFGFVGGSDGHGLSWHHGVSRKQDSHRTGLTGFLSSDRTRSAVFEALSRRRCYATSGAKIGLWFEIDGHPMGEALVARTPVPFRVTVSATEAIRSLALVSNGGLEHALDVTGRTADIEGTLPPPSSAGFAYYYVRIVQVDNEVAWSSPIWLDSPEPA